MERYISLVGPERTLQVFGLKLVGVNADTGKKLILSILLVGALLLIRFLLARGLSLLLRGDRNERARFWTRQGISILLLVVLIVGILSIWFDQPARLATALGLVSAGLAFALQKVVTAFAAYFVILRGKMFTVGDRITMGGVRGDVIGLGFIQTRVMEMGQPPSVNAQADPAMWVRARQYTGRIVSITNDKIFEEPVYNFSRDFPYIWEEMNVPISYGADRDRAERIIREAAERHTEPIHDLGEDALRELERRFLLKPTELGPRTYLRITDNWVELTVRFLVKDHAIREVKDRMSRDILKGLDEAKIGIASGTYEIVGVPPLRVQIDGAPGLGRLLGTEPAQQPARTS